MFKFGSYYFHPDHIVMIRPWSDPNKNKPNEVMVYTTNGNIAFRSGDSDGGYDDVMYFLEGHTAIDGQ